MGSILWARESPFFWRFFMRPLHRRPVNKHKSAKRFRKHVKKSKAPNVAGAPMRGGWRL